jgi:hypothetical protein
MKKRRDDSMVIQREIDTYKVLVVSDPVRGGGGWRGGEDLIEGGGVCLVHRAKLAAVCAFVAPNPLKAHVPCF